MQLKTLLTTLALSLTASSVFAANIELLNVSYDPTRELYQDYNKAFSAYYKKKTGDDVTIKQSHGGSGKQARAILDGLEADVATLALAYDIDELSTQGKLLKPDWQKQFPDNASPYTSTILFLVKKGNPKNIKDWNDLIRSDVKVITPNPKTSGGARWNYLAAWGYALKQPGGNDAKAREFVQKIYKNVPVLDTGARGSTVTFTQRGIGDVLVTWENEAELVFRELGRDKFEVVAPSYSIKAEPPVAIVDKNVDKKGTRKVATEYLNYLYSKEGQEIIAQNYYRPLDKDIAAKYAKQFPAIKLFDIDDVFGGWTKAQKTHFSDGGIFDQIYAPSK
ncbi:sulfate ABC transporter substrate-binding protein [Chitinibacter bivalviorum]|uniref:Sulfate-binding protein n=1 Tax=Chitinibacter bivalviorum TaxID=2739434 RepID=A0A7H9BLI3_9NEIS|nr:sulfate ABC transporter substrate-binding protein [Chitinibacter bivalviorum]QLG89453.1 sulfate ABC transporter substrate-binding protein [Chitinibacter bivalviorum]